MYTQIGLYKMQHVLYYMLSFANKITQIDIETFIEVIAELLASKKPIKTEHYPKENKKNQNRTFSLGKSSHRTDSNIFLLMKQRCVHAFFYN